MSVTFDPSRLIQPDWPAEWGAPLPPEVLRAVVPPNGIYTLEQRAEQDRLLRARWFLIRNEHRLRCGDPELNYRDGCGAIHEYLTLGCIERPFNGLQHVVNFFAADSQGRVLKLNEPVRPDHDPEINLTGVAFGRVVPISRHDAATFVYRIRLRLGPDAI